MRNRNLSSTFDLSDLIGGLILGLLLSASATAAPASTSALSPGCIAQDVAVHFPEVVTVVEDERSAGLHALNYSGVSVLAVKAIQEQQAIIEQQQAQIATQEQVIADVAKRLAAIEATLAQQGQ